MSGVVSWDDRLARDAKIADIRESKVREHLRAARSGLFDEPDARRVCRRMRISGAANGVALPRNVGLLLFSADPCEWFRGARIEVVQFAADRGGDVQDERVFRGGLMEQVDDCLVYLENRSGTLLRKNADRPQASTWERFPRRAVREVLVNAVCHRSYREDTPEPIKVHVLPDRMVIASYPGPVPGIMPEHFAPAAEVPNAIPRNRRITEFMKERGLAELRLSGVPKIFSAMERNGSPPPEFEFDEGRTFFQVTLRAHPIHVAVSAMRDIGELRAIGRTEEAEQRLEAAWSANPQAAVLATEMVRLHASRGELRDAETVLEVFVRAGEPPETAQVANAVAEALARDDRRDDAGRVLSRFVDAMEGRDAIAAAILARRIRRPELARRCFERAGTLLLDDPRALLEYCQTKLQLAGTAHRSGQRDLNRQLLDEALTLLRRVLRLDATPTRQAWAWRETARTLNWLGRPAAEVEDAYRKAIAAAPQEERFAIELEAFRAR